VPGRRYKYFTEEGGRVSPPNCPRGIRHIHTVCILHWEGCLYTNRPPCKIRHIYTVCTLQGGVPVSTHPLIPRQYCLFTPELQPQSRGKTAYLTGRGVRTQANKAMGREAPATVGYGQGRPGVCANHRHQRGLAELATFCVGSFSYVPVGRYVGFVCTPFVSPRRVAQAY
jgi:hypothetical protein